MLIAAALAASLTTDVSDTVDAFLRSFSYKKPTRQELLLCSSMHVSARGSIDRPADQKCLEAVEEFNHVIVTMARECVRDLSKDMRHNTLHCLSWGHSLSHVCGFTLEQFGMLFSLTIPALSALFPHSEVLAEPTA